MSSRFSRRTVLGWGLLTAAVGIQAQPSQTLPRFVIKLAVSEHAASAFQHLPLVLAQALGYFRAEGVTLSIVRTQTDAQAIAAVARGQANVCAVGFEQIALQPVHTSYWCRAFVLEGRAPQVALGAVLSGKNGNHKLAELSGKRVGVDARGTMAHLVAVRALTTAGVAAGQYTIIPVGTGQQALHALQARTIDALCMGDPVMAQLEQQSRLRVLADTRTIAGTSALLGGTIPGGCLSASALWLQNEGEAAQAVTNAIVRAIKWLHTAAPNDIIRLVPQEEFLGDRAVYLSALLRARNAIALDGLMPERVEHSLAHLLLPWAGAGQMPGLGRLYTGEFALKSRQRWLM